MKPNTKCLSVLIEVAISEFQRMSLLSQLYLKFIQWLVKKYSLFLFESIKFVNNVHVIVFEYLIFVIKLGLQRLG